MDWLKFIGFLFLVAFPIGHLLYSWLVPVRDRAIAASVALGLFIITLETYLLGITGLYSLAVPVIFVQGLLVWILLIYLHPPGLLIFYKIPLIAWVFIITAVFVNCLMLVPFGRMTTQGIFLFGAHFVDSTWHLALINNLNISVPPENPILSGTLLTNYHYLVDLQISLIHKSTGIPVPNLYFQMIGPLYLFLLSVLVYRFSFSISRSILAGISSVTILLLGSNYYYLFGSNPSIAWVDFFSTKTVNYPLLYSLILIIIFLEIGNNNKLCVKKSIVFGILSGSLFLVKSHSALVWIGGLGLYSLIYGIKSKSWVFLSFLVSIAILAVTYLFTVTSGTSALSISPLWFIKSMYESPDRLNQSVWELSRQTLLAKNAYLGIVKLYAIGVFTFISINYGPLIFGLFTKRLPKILLTLFIVSLLSPLLLIQRGAAWNSIQFIYVAFLPIALGVSLLISYIYKNNRLIGITTLILLFCSLLPGNKYISNQYAAYVGRYDISPNTVVLIKYLKSLPGNSILTDSSMWSGSYLQAYSGKSLYIGDQQMLESLSLDPTTRKNNIQSIYNCTKVTENIDYLIISDKNIVLGSCYQLLNKFKNYSVYKRNI